MKQSHYVLNKTDDASLIMVALANTNGGSFEAEVHTSATLHNIAQQCQPPIELTQQGDTYFINRSPTIHADPDGIVWVERQSGLEKLDRDGIHQLSSERVLSLYEDEPIENLTAGLFIEEYSRPDLGADMLDSLFTSGNRITVADILLFAENPKQWLPQNRVLIEVYPTKYSYDLDNAANVSVSEQISSRPLDLLLTETVSRLTFYMGTNHPFLSQLVSELIRNAILHREYRIQAPIIIKFWLNQLEIHTPGGFPSIVNSDTVFQTKYPRNIKVFNLYHTVVSQKMMFSGLDNYHSQINDNSHLALEIEDMSQQLITRVKLIDQAQVSKPNSNELTMMQQRIMQHLIEYGSITERELKTIFTDIPFQNLENSIQGLVDLGYLRMFSLRSGKRYVLAEPID